MACSPLQAPVQRQSRVWHHHWPGRRHPEAHPQRGGHGQPAEARPGLTRGEIKAKNKEEKNNRKNARCVTTPGPRAPTRRVITAPPACPTSGGRCVCAGPDTGGATARPGTWDNLATQVSG